jgi:hypothetical protein
MEGQELPVNRNKSVGRMKKKMIFLNLQSSIFNLFSCPLIAAPRMKNKQRLILQIMPQEYNVKG